MVTKIEPCWVGTNRLLIPEPAIIPVAEEKIVTIRLLLALVFVCALAPAQRRVDPRNMYERVLAVVPMVGSGTPADPVRPAYAPLPTATAIASQVPAAATASGVIPLRQGILAYSYVVSDDGKFALAEFVAADRAAFKALLADTTVTSFLKGRDSIAAAVTLFQTYKQSFTLNMLGAIVP
jgi:hypothetical protein